MISHWFDFDLVAELARRRPGWTIVLVGPADRRAQPGLDMLAGLANIIALGERPSDLIPAYAQAFDVGIVPFRLTEMTATVTPLKMYEYLAAGTPCVSVPLLAARAEEGIVATASDPAGFEAAIRASLEASNPDLCRRAARRADWSERLKPVLETLGGRLRLD